MNCNESQSLMSAYLDHELDAPAMADYAAHLASCQACSTAFEHLSNLQATVRSNAEAYAAPDSLRTRILSDLGTGKLVNESVDESANEFANKPAKGAENKSPRRTFNIFAGFNAWPWGRINFGIASLCSVAFAVTLALYLQAPSETDFLDREIVATHFRSLQVDHLADVASSDRHTVKPWFSGKLDYSPPVVDLAQDGYALIGGRLDYLQQRSVAGLAYRHGKHLLNLFVWPDQTGHDTVGKLTSVHGFQLLRWSHGGMAYTAVSDMSADELLAFEKLLIAQIDAAVLRN
ncbi:MAG: anti-sigma factor [Herbaspirillum sp.]|nr:anti-sigma factor [Herbaspirillum sp.]